MMTNSGTAAPGLTDAETCGEDLPHNLKRMITIAPASCAGCSDYHIFNAAKRLSGHTPWSHGARGYLFDMLAPLFAELSERAEDRFDVVVAACADTAILSTCAHAVWRQHEGLLSRVRFTVLDRCRSPLVLCEEYAARHGLEVRTEAVDLLDTSASFPADLIVLHNFLPFVPMEQHALLMKTLHGWLKPNGNLFMWNTVLAAEDHEAIALRWKAQIAAVKSMIEAGTIEINEPKEVLFARLDRNVADTRPGMRRCADIESMKELIASAGLRTKSIEEISKTRRERGTSYIRVVAGRSAEA
jgi:hypothetical protein